MKTIITLIIACIFLSLLTYYASVKDLRRLQTIPIEDRLTGANKVIYLKLLQIETKVDRLYDIEEKELEHEKSSKSFFDKNNNVS